MLETSPGETNSSEHMAAFKDFTAGEPKEYTVNKDGTVDVKIAKDLANAAAEEESEA